MADWHIRSWRWVRSIRLRRRWLTWVLAGIGVLLLLGALIVGAGIIWLANNTTSQNPLALDRWIPRVEAMLAERGISVKIGSMDTFYEKGVVLRIEGLEAYGSDGALGLVVEQAGMRLSTGRLLGLQPSPKSIEARGVTIRLVQKDKQLAIAGLTLPGRGAASDEDALSRTSLVSWLNGMHRDPVWGRLKRVVVGKVTVLFRDEDRGAEWVLEGGEVRATRFRDSGEESVAQATLRRIYGRDKAPEPMPVYLYFKHEQGADEATIALAARNADTQLAEDYLPENVRGIVDGRGELEVGTTLDSRNRIADPWLTARLGEVQVQAPAGFSKPWKFNDFEVTMSYAPTPTDVLTIRRMQVRYASDTMLLGRGTIARLTTDPLFNVVLASPKGDAQRIFDFLPDQKLTESLEWLRPNIRDAKYANLVGRFAGPVSAFPHCGEACGVTMQGDITGGRIQFLPTMPEGRTTLATMVLEKQHLEFKAAKASVGKGQTVENLRVRVNNLFDPSPTLIEVDGVVKGDAAELATEVAELAKLNPPGRLRGKHATGLALRIPIFKGRDTELEEMSIAVNGRLSDAVIDEVKDLPGTYVVPSGTVVITDKRRVRVWTDGEMNGAKLNVRVSDQLDKFSDQFSVSLRGQLPAAWLGNQLGAGQGISVSGALGGTAWASQTTGGWEFDVNADAAAMGVQVSPLNWTKPVGTALQVRARGNYTEATPRVNLSRLQLSGGGTDVRGSADIFPKTLDRSVVKLSPFKLGANDAAIDWVPGRLSVSGRRLDVRGFDIFGEPDKPAKATDDSIKDLSLNLQLNELLMKEGKLENVTARMAAEKGQWDIERLRAVVDGTAKVNIEKALLPGQGGRRKMSVDISDTGKVLKALGLYENLRGGHLSGDIVYDTPEIGAGVLTMTNFELLNPPILVQLLSLLSLEQILSGTSATLFNEARMPLRLEGGQVALDQVMLVGPSLSLRLNGAYNRVNKEMTINGKMAPAIPFNRLVTKIPLLGTILAGSQDGVVVADFKIKGTADNPDISVQPLSLLTPGLLKDFWQGLTGGNKDAAKPPVVIDGRKR